MWANFECANLRSANCKGASFIRANLKNATLSEALFEDADLSHACLDFVWLPEALDFRTVNLTCTSLIKTRFGGSNFESVQARSANFAGSYLEKALFTESDMRGASFENADLRECGLFGVSWSDVDLRGADLRGATFHAGSSRSGLVDSFLASEGTRTGFYTDEYLEQTFRSPEEIRVADLRGADLRGANIFETDFYLVDLRGAKYHDAQAEHLRRCGAILETRV